MVRHNLPADAGSPTCHSFLCAGPQMSRIIADWKGFHARRSRIKWQQGFFDHRLRNNERGEQLPAKADYIRRNPVAAGLCERVEDWPWVYRIQKRIAQPLPWIRHSRWIGRSEGDATIKAAEPLKLSPTALPVLTSRSERAIHQSSFQHRRRANGAQPALLILSTSTNIRRDIRAGERIGPIDRHPSRGTRKSFLRSSGSQSFHYRDKEHSPD
jgi:hypothetical protein